MSTKTVHQQQLQNQLTEWNKQLSDLKEKADHASDFDSKAEYNGQVERVHALQQAARKKLKDLENTQQNVWNKLEADVRNLDLMFK